MAVFPNQLKPMTQKGKIDTKTETVDKSVQSVDSTIAETAAEEYTDFEGGAVPAHQSVTHPVTDEVLSFASREEYVDWLSKEWGAVLSAENTLRESKKAVRERIDLVAGMSEKQRGTVKLVGNETEITLTRVQRATYSPVVRGQPSVLQIAYEQIEEIRECVSVRFEEKLAKMDKFLASIMEQDSDDPEIVELQSVLSVIVANRSISQATPTIKVKVV